MAGTGGAREGAGRPIGKRNKATEQVKEILAKVVDFEIVFEKLFELTKGIKVQRMSLDGPIVYTERPDPAAAKILIEYGFGKPSQPIEHSGEITTIKVIRGA